MAIAQPITTDLLDNPSHSTLHRIIAADTSAAVKSIQISTTQSIISAPADGTTAIQFNKADLTTNVLNIDTTNSRVGIGTTGPADTFGYGGKVLDVAGPAYFRQSGDATKYISIGTSGGDSYLEMAGVSALRIYTSGNEKMRLSNAGGLSLGNSYVGTDPGAGNMIIQGNVGIGTTSPTNLLSLGGNSARIFWMERHTTANTAGNTLTIQAGGATSAATDKNGGDLILNPGVSTGSGESGIQIQGCVAGASGTADRSFSIIIQVLGNKLGFYGVTPITRAVLATGAGHTVDDVITALQNLGLVSQS